MVIAATIITGLVLVMTTLPKEFSSIQGRVELEVAPCETGDRQYAELSATDSVDPVFFAWSGKNKNRI